MKTILTLLSLCTALSFGQASSSTARRIIRDAGAPSAATCDTASEVSNVYVRMDSASTASPLYICTNTGVGTYAWVLSGAGGAAATVPFSGITAATNTTAAMVVGTGASLAPSGSGTIAATEFATNPADCSTEGFFAIGIAANGDANCESQLHVITFVIDGGGSAIATGDLNLFPTANFTCNISRTDISADQSGSITVDIWKRAAAIPTSAQKISSTNPVTLASQQLNQNGSIAGWTTSVSAGDIFGGTIVTASTVERVTIQIWCVQQAAP